jgi:hypothetical protein
MSEYHDATSASLGIRLQTGEGDQETMLDQYGSVLCVACASSMRLATIEPGEARHQHGSCLNAGIRHAQNPALWCSADCGSGKTRSSRERRKHRRRVR